MAHMGLESLSDTYQGEDSVDDICNTFLQKYIFGVRHRDKADDSLYNLCTSLLYHLLLYVDLRQAIRYDNGPAIVAHWSFWLATLLGTGRTQYSTEAANFICNMKADWSEAISNLATHNRTINTHGREGHSKPIDMLVEHYNKILKGVYRASGGHLTVEHAKDASLAVQMFDEARKFCSKLFNTRQTVRHSVPSADRDIKLMTDAVVDEKTYNITPGRRLLGNKTFENPVTKGMAKITEAKWLESFLQKEDGRLPQTPDATDANMEGGNNMVEEEDASDDNSDDNADSDESDDDDTNTDLLMDE
ncbi:PREDICTED: uncharacterized protein LOC109482999 [Branchiostoma belcheri]|uniref:Uncharacterized protein LOC109482999 n=1 Tax=Branchiostoma belcheri TaxID=7741 RepID=A0A6P5AHZ7_BRABE|nr:PREDICTED: uncharacterized protein LOC109482999 [Branchiostoma belcheri]